MSDYTPHVYLLKTTDSSGADYYRLSVWVDVAADETIGTPLTQIVDHGSYQTFEATLPVVADPGAAATEKRLDFDIYLTANDRAEVSTKKGSTVKAKARVRLSDADDPA